MTRRRRRSKRDRADTINDLSEKIQSQLGGSPLSEVKKRLLEALQWLQYSTEENIDWAQVHRDFSGFLDRLPDKFGPRFYFDAYHLHSVKEQWTGDAATLPSMLVPVPRQEWCYERFRIPVTLNGDVHLVGVPNRSDGIERPFLLDYPFLIHETGHVHLEHFGHRFKRRFEEVLKTVLNQQARRRMPLRGQAKAQSESKSEDIKRHWSIERRGTWAFELAIDVIALWTCGPAYIDTLTHYLREHYDDKFQIEPSHPPATLRGDVLARAARRLGWSNHVEELETIVDDWMDEGPPSFNRYQSLTDDRIVESCLDAAFDYCDTVELPRLTQNDLSRIENQLEQREELTGTDLIVGAWIVDQRRDEEANDRWEKNVFRSYVEDLRKEVEEVDS